MQLKAKIENGEIVFAEKRFAKEVLQRLEGKKVLIDIQTERKICTTLQNRALHLYFSQLAEALNDAGYDMKKVIKVDVNWTDYSIKEYLWKPVQRSLFGKKSTTQLKTDEIDKIYDVVNRAIGQRTGIHIPWPSIETMMENNL